MKRILIPMLEAGAGHKVPALAIQEALERLYPGQYVTEVVDWPKACGADKTDRKMKGAWDYGLAHGWAARLGYLLVVGLPPVAKFWARYFYPEFQKKAEAYLNEWKPDLILSTNFFTSVTAAQAKRHLGLKAPVLSFVTDPFDAYGWWVEPRLDEILVASDKARNQVIARGYPANQVFTFPFPVHHKFQVPPANPEALRAELGLQPGVPTILTSEGGQGIGKTSGFILKLHEEGYPCNVIAVCGRNEALKKELEARQAAHPTATKLIPLGFVSNMQDLLSVSDLCAVKAGASTTFEAVAKGVPPLFVSWATYSEKPNIDFCVDQGIGWFTPTYDEFRQALSELEKPEVRQRIRDRIEALGHRSGADAIAQHVHAHFAS